MMNRRRFFAVSVSMFAAPRAGWAQEAVTKHRIGWVGAGTRVPAFREAFLTGLSELGFIVGRNVSIEYRSLANPFTPSPEVVKDLLQGNVEVIIATSTPAALSAKQATQTIPIVMVGVRDPAEQGIITGLSRPGGNITGIAAGAGSEIATKRLALIKEALPRASRIGHVWSSVFPGARPYVDEMLRVATTLKVTVHPFDVGGSDELPGVFARMRSRGIEAISVEAALQPYRKRIVELAAASKLPAVYGTNAFVEDGGLMSYSADWREIYRKAGNYVGKILKGAKPADLPVEQPTKFDFAINLKTARALGLTIPQSLLLRADQIIE